MKKIKTWIVDHPYFSTGVVFLIIVLTGWRVLYWREENFTFILLLYFIVTLGIRLDDISRKLGTRSDAAAGHASDSETIMHELTQIKHTLLNLNATLNRILEKAEKKDP
jgi:cytochrome b561